MRFRDEYRALCCVFCPGSAVPEKYPEPDIRNLLLAHLKRFPSELHYSVRPEIGSSQEEGRSISAGVTRSP
jgi:hypothetical protein